MIGAFESSRRYDMAMLDCFAALQLWGNFCESISRVEWRRKTQGGATVEMGWWRWFVITRTVTTVRRAALKRVGVDQYAAGAVRKLKRVLSVLLGPLLPELSKKDPTSIVRHY